MNKKATIVGGGTAGYMSAAYFVNQGYDVTIIYNNEDNPRLVVGESLTANTYYFLERLCGFKRAEWMIGSDAVHKNVVYYRDWGKEGEVFLNGWRKEAHKDEDYLINKDKTYQEVVENELYSHQFFDSNKTSYTKDDLMYPKSFDSSLNYKGLGRQNASEVPHGVQLNALELTKFIKSKIQDRITTITDTVVDVFYEGNNVTSLTLKSGKKIPVEFIVDASGFAKVVARTSPLFEEEDISDITFPNRALFTILEYKDIEAEMKPRTGTFRGDHGWAWHTPTAKRIGSGYVFNSNYCSDEEALEDFAKIVDTEIPRDVSFINFSNTRTKNVLMGNILCVGMSSGFIEPMESPALLGVQLTFHYFHTKKDVNKIMRRFTQSMCKWIGLRYKTSSYRDTPFWNYVHDPKKCSYLLETIERFKKDGFIKDVGYKSGECMPPRCFDDMVRSSMSPNVTLTKDVQDNLSMKEYLDELRKTI